MKLAAAIVVLTTGTARADDYTTPVVVTDAIGDAMLIGAHVMAVRAADQKKPGDVIPAFSLAIVGAGLATLGGPIVHVMHDEGDRMAADLVARVAAPIIAASVGCHVSPSRAGCEIGYFAGLLVAQAFDWLYLTRLDDDPTATPRTITFGGAF